MKYHNRLREFRLSKGLTLWQVAKLFDKRCEDRLSEWERGLRMPNVLNLLKLCEIYEKTLQEIYPKKIEELHQEVETITY